ncbi:rod shape-determining protein RodA [Pelagibius sp. 7325]|uniref:rod shape-determining protein RodA n=1 Tax=Pelagibius sp. 7325 TaxID=3131994 RepID=UPI0030EE6963
MPADVFLSTRNPEMKLRQKIWQLNWGMVLLLCLVAGVGFAMLYSAANGAFDPWASAQMMRFGLGFTIMIVVALVDIRFWYRYAYLIYFGSFALLGAVEVMGDIGMGAQRWIDLGFVRLQPSEMMKVALVLALARYFHGLSMEDVGRPLLLLLPLGMVMAPAGLVLKQPDLGTAGMLILASGAVFFSAGVRWWKFALLIVAGLASGPVAWGFLHDYQKDRVLTFLNPENDPLGAGYHTLQAMIGFGSGAITGKGFMQGTQSHLNFLPEKQTDFIFTMLAEEFGLVGSLTLLVLYFLLLAYGFAIAFRARNQFARLLALGLTTNLFLYVFINMAMVMGMFPVVGVPLPLVSYGGTVLLTVMASMGLVMSCYIHRDVRISRRGTAEV